MNPIPHNHEIEGRVSYSDYLIDYGDTRVVLHGTKNPRPWRVKRGIKRAIRQHDKGTIEAAEVEQLKKAGVRIKPKTRVGRRKLVIEDMNKALLGPPPNQWRRFGNGNEDLEWWPSQRMPEWDEEYDPKDVKPLEGSIVVALTELYQGDTIRVDGAPFSDMRVVSSSGDLYTLKSLDGRFGAAYEYDKQLLTWKELVEA